ncbi:HAMP domain-containing histidine kinase [Chitinophaga horti]|uniref:histidine kinase n=1 Tax=Chitinophaga horti TaxID=2920382 RepID=A0ABY6IX18_9BACT|nr:HAMP domain-containing sensor histidine kinase [Chitinophaga horti]UYQ91783.1 HAMP domain-containing histidine kinase [Chitinophaga horti]
MLNLRSPIVVHALIAITSFLVLSSVLFFLLYNTYELKNQHYYLAEKKSIEEEYGRNVRDDKLFPGGAHIIESYVIPHMLELEQQYHTNPKGFNELRQRLMDSIFAALKKANSVDSILEQASQKYQLRRDLSYALTFQVLNVNFRNSEKGITLFNIREQNPLIKSVPLMQDGALVGGTLQERNKQNQITNLTVSSGGDYTYTIVYSLHVDTANRKVAILRLMLPNLLLSLFSILAVVTIYFITFRNWQKQKKLSEMKSDFINSITHEFHTPLSAIFVANKSLRNERIIANQQNIPALTDVIQRQAERLKHLIGQVLNITTLGQIPLNAKPHSLHALLEEIMLDYRLKVAGSNIHLTFIKEATRDAAMVDQFWFTTLMLNMLDNGVKYNTQSEKLLTVKTTSDKKYCYISIADNGIGMNKETRERVFEKFYRSIKNNNQQIKGLGLGLYYAKQAADAHQWKINVQSTPGEGSMFIITIPL